MKKPSKKPQLLKKYDDIDLINADDGVYTANEIEEIAQQMRELGIDKVGFNSSYDDVTVYLYTLESEEEALIRYSKEIKTYDKFKKRLTEREKIKREKHLEKVRKQAIKLGLINE